MKVAKHRYTVEASASQSLRDLRMAEGAPIVQEHLKDRETGSCGPEAGALEQVTSAGKFGTARVRGFVRFR